MAEMKTQPTDESVSDYLARVSDDNRRSDCLKVLELMKDVSGAPPKMWGRTIVGFGSYRYKYPSGREGEWFITGFAPRKQNLSIHVLPGLESFGDLLPRLGKYKAGKSCLYVKRLADIDLGVLRELLARAVQRLSKVTVGG